MSLDEVKFPNDRYKEYSNEDLFYEAIQILCELHARGQEPGDEFEANFMDPTIN